MKTQSSNTRTRLAGAVLVALIATPLARADYPSTVLSQAPVGYWRLSETIQPPPPPINATNIGSVGSPAGDGIYNSATRGVLPGAIAGDPANACVLLPGVTANRVRIPWQPQWNPTGAYSVEFWAKPAQNATLQCPAASVEFIASPVTQRNGWLIYQGDSGLATGNGWVFRQYNSTGLANQTGVAANMTIDTTHWYYVVATFDGTSLRLYVDGALAAGPTALAGTSRANTNSAIPLTFGARADGASGYFEWHGQMDEAAMYNTALSSGQVLTHYQAGTNASPATPYRTVVLNDSPVGYWRFGEPGDPPAANLGTLGSAAAGIYLLGSHPGGPGPKNPPYPGFEAANKAVSFDGTGGSVNVPALNLNTSAATITAWVNATNSQTLGASLVLCHAGSTYAGLTIDPISGGLGLGYVWNGSTAGWSPSGDSGLPTLPDSAWAFVAMVISPTNVTLSICDQNPVNFASAGITYGHASQAFDGITAIGADPTLTTKNFNGAIDEVAIFNRSLSQGEVFSQYATAVGGVAPRIFTDLQGPAAPVAAGDPLVLIVDAGGTQPMTYTWHRGGGTIATTTNGVLTIASATLGDSGNYDVLISNGIGTPAQSQQVSVSVVLPTSPTITKLIGFNNRSLYPGGTLSLGVVANGGGLKYQWLKGAAPIASATASTFSIPSVVSNDAGGYSVMVTNLLGTNTAGPVTLTVLTPATNTYAARIVADHPVSWWRLNEAPGSTNMWDSLGRNDGYYTNLTSSTPLVTLGATGALVNDSDTAATFVAANKAFGLVPISTALNPKVLTVECWVKTTNSADALVPVSSRVPNAGWYWQTATGSGVHFWAPDGSDAAHGDFGTPLDTTANAATAAVVSGQWKYLVLEIDTSSGFPVGPIIDTVGFGNWGFNAVGNYNSSGPLLIGARGAGAATLADRFFDGQVDEVAFYDYALTPTQITNHFLARGIVIIPPTFTTPLLSQTVISGSSVNFSTSLLGTAPIALRWYKNGTPISGATSATYTITNTVLADTGTYTLWATNGAGTNSLSATLTVIPPVNYANVTNGLVLHLRFDGDTSDTSGRANNGTAVGGPTFVPGIIGPNALQYITTTLGNTSGGPVTASSYVNFGTPADLEFGTSSFTVGLWAKTAPGDLQGDLPYIGNATNSNVNPGWDLSPGYKTGGWQWNVNDKTNNVNQSGGAINDGAWHNFIVVVDRGSNVVNTFVDGQLQDVTGIGVMGNFDDNGARIVVGQDPTGLYTEPGTNTVDDVAIWRRALTQLEVVNISSAGHTSGRSFDTVGPVSLGLTKSGSNWLLLWGAGTLLQSDTVGAGSVWTPVPGAAAPSYTIVPSATKKFYRVKIQ